MRKFKIWKDPYCHGWDTCIADEIEIKEGLTVIVGCNGAGKTTLLQNIEDELVDNKVPVKLFNNLNSGGYSAEEAFFNDDIEFGAALMTSSEGESISLRLGQHASKLHNFLRTGKYKKNDRIEAFAEALRSFGDNSDDKPEIVSNERWLLFDATDSGYSIDNIIELKDLFTIIEKDAERCNVELYIVISANEYELANGENCFDVHEGKYIRFKDYDDYRQYIINSRKIKEQRYEKPSKRGEDRSHGEKGDTD